MKKHFITRSFTLLELIIVIIIVGILATLAFGQYVRVIEKGRTAEAKSNLGMIRKMSIAQFQETGAWITTPQIRTFLGLPNVLGAACLAVAPDNQYWYSYTQGISGGPPAFTTYTATRCTANGKAPPVAAADAYTISLTSDGTGSSLPAGWW